MSNVPKDTSDLPEDEEDEYHDGFLSHCRVCGIPLYDISGLCVDCWFRENCDAGAIDPT